MNELLAVVQKYRHVTEWVWCRGRASVHCDTRGRVHLLRYASRVTERVGEVKKPAVLARRNFWATFYLDNTYDW